MKKHLARQNKGYVMVALMFLIAVSVPAFIAATYFNLSNQSKNIQYRIQDTQLKWLAMSGIDRTQYELRNLIDTETLEDSKFDMANSLELQDTLKTRIQDTWLGNFKTNFSNFLNLSSMTPTQAVAGAEFVTTCGPTCYFASVTSIDSSLGTASFLLNAKVHIPGNQSTGQAWAITQTISVATSNLSDYSIFTFHDFVTSPGTDTTYEGPMYVGGDAYITPNKGKTVTFTYNTSELPFDTEKPTPYVLKTHGNIFWYGPRALGPDPYHLNDPNSYEKDLYGAPVFYYYTSNNDPGWVNFNPTNDGSGKSTIQVLSNDLVNYTQLIGSQRQAPAVSMDKDSVFPSLRGKYEVDDNLRWDMTHYYPLLANFTKTTTMHTAASSMVEGDNAVITPSTAFDGDNPRFIPKDPDWTTSGGLKGPFLDNFKKDNFYIFEDNATEQKLRLGGANDPHILIESALDSDSNSFKKVKLQWLAKQNNDTTVPPPPNQKFFGISIDYGKAGSLTEEDSTLWEAVTYNNGLNSPRLIAPNPSLASRYYDQRTGRYFLVINVDIGALTHIIRSEQPVLPISGNHSNKIPNDKPILLYIGLATAHMVGDVDGDDEVGFTDFMTIINNFDRNVPPYTLGDLSGNGHVGMEDYNLLSTNYGISNKNKPGIIRNTLIRLVNAKDIPDQGLTVASNGFIQIVGDYNTTAPDNSSICKQADPLHVTMKPAAVIGDQIMVLSKSWQDFDSTNVAVLAPSTYTDPYDGKTYTTPKDAAGNLFTSKDYNAHPIRCDKATEPNCADVTVNAMLLGGDVPNGFKKYTQIYNVWPYGFGRDFYSNNLTGFDATESLGEYWNNPLDPDADRSQWTWDAYGHWFANTRTTGAYLRKEYVKRQNGGYDPHDNVLVDADGTLCGANPPATCKPRKGDLFADPTLVANRLTDAAYNAMRVYIATFDANDRPTTYTDIGSVGSLFNSTNCPSCNGDIPLYLKVNEAGEIMHDNIEEDHIKGVQNDRLGGPGIPGKVGALYDYRIQPGERFAALNDYSPINDTIHPSEANQPYLIAARGFTDPGSWGWHVPGTGTPCSPVVTGHYTCANPDQCAFECQNVAGGEGCTPTCNNSSCNAIYDNSCQWTPSPPNGPIIITPPLKKVVYSVGGKDRFRTGFVRDSTDFWKHRFDYIPYSVPMYSGGLENFIRLGESWKKWNCTSAPCTPLAEKNTLKINGTLDILWASRTLVNSVGEPAYWDSSTYDAPDRIIKYATQLRKDACVPPGIPTAIQMTPEGFKQE